MAPPNFPSSLRPSRNALNFTSSADRRQPQARNNQGRRPTQDDHIDWRDWSLISLYVTDLPIDVTTLQVWRNFKKFGELSYIDIKPNSDHRGRSATVTYKPPPAVPFWEVNTPMRYQHGKGVHTDINVRLDRQQTKNQTIPSPTRANVKYNQEYYLIGDRIDFGVLTEPSSFLALRTRVADKNFSVRFGVNLYFKEISVFFPSAFTSDNSGLKVREYRFRVAFDQNFRISQIGGPDDDIILFLDIDSPPPYFKKLSEAARGSHVDEARTWREDDLWARQTDIADTKNKLLSIDKLPVSVEKGFVSIETGRWLAFRISFPRSNQNETTLRILQDALKDFNVSIKHETQLKVRLPTDKDKPALWRVLDQDEIVKDSTASSRLLTLMTPHIKFAFPVRYQLEVCVSHRLLSEYTIDQEFLTKLASFPQSKALQFLRAVDHRGQIFLRPMDVFEDMDFRKPVKTPKLPENCMEIHHATVTPTTVYFNTPSVEITNRVIRQYKQHADRFLRVRFEDDEYRGNTRLYASVNNKMTNVFARVRRTLKHGIVLGPRHYRFLAWGNSQLKQHGAYLFADLPGVITADDIRRKMGEFSKEKIVAKCAARMGQCFSTTRTLTCRLPRIHESVCIADIRTADRQYIFTDGVGKMSDMVARLAGDRMGIKNDVPSVIQFRLGGCKGVLTIDPNMRGAIDIRVRESQFKFASPSNDLEIIRCSNFATADLNRQLILVLSELGVEDGVFLKIQEALINDITKAMTSDDAAVRALLDRVDPNLMTPVIADIIGKGSFRAAKEPFVTSVLRLWRSWSLKYLKEKARLPIPKSAFVLGCTDETQNLRGHFHHPEITKDTSYEEQEKWLPEIFLQITDQHSGNVLVVEGLCVVARNPSLHRGDIRVVKAVDVLALHHIRDAVVFPQTGHRDLPSMCSGGDLDGDDFVVIWDQDLLPTVWNQEPFHYKAPTPKQAEDIVSTDQIISFFVDYMENDFLGRIAHAHLAWADDKGLDSDECLRLVELHSMSVDYAKTGVPARMEKHLVRDGGYPHFMEKKGKPYHSRKILGKLYDAVEKVRFEPEYDMNFDSRIINAASPPEVLYQHVKILKASYDDSMRQIMAQHKIKTEFEVWTTFVLDHSKKSTEYKFHEEIGRISATLKEQYFITIADLMGGRSLEHLAPFAVAAYRFTQMQVHDALKHKDETDGEDSGYGEMPFISFPWLLHETLTKIAAGALLRSDDGEGTNDAGITFDEEGNPVFPVFPALSGVGLSLPTTDSAPCYSDPSQGIDQLQKGDPLQKDDLLQKDDASVGEPESIESRMKALLVEDSDSD
jgi:RNA-dependent RNA polymerase